MQASRSNDPVRRTFKYLLLGQRAGDRRQLRASYYSHRRLSLEKPRKVPQELDGRFHRADEDFGDFMASKLWRRRFAAAQHLAHFGAR